jgi:hypothetical protein
VAGWGETESFCTAAIVPTADDERGNRWVRWVECNDNKQERPTAVSLGHHKSHVDCPGIEPEATYLRQLMLPAEETEQIS